MIKKFVSDALLSVVMDKEAREKLKGMRSGTPEKPKKKQRTESASGEDVVDTIAQALAEARAEVASGKHDLPPSRQSIAQQHRQPSAPPPAGPSDQGRPASPERQRLIDEAMAIHRQKSHVLEELDPELREKLMVMAMYAMDPSSLPPEVRAKAKIEAEAEGPVDEIGGNAPSRRKKTLPSRKT